MWAAGENKQNVRWLGLLIDKYTPSNTLLISGTPVNSVCGSEDNHITEEKKQWWSEKKKNKAQTLIHKPFYTVLKV